MFADQVESEDYYRVTLAMPTIISLLNLKGGVAKTTTTVQLADYFSFIGKRVLVIDLDPQANATESLLGRFQSLAISPDEISGTGGPDNLSISQCFFDYLEGTKYFDIQKVLCKNTSNLNNVEGPDLLPSSLNLLDVQDRLSEIPKRSGYMIGPIEVLKFVLTPIMSNYDFILIDCPPSLNLMTRNALEISKYYLVPVINDPLSTRGLYQILKRVHDYADIRQWNIQCAGVLITKYRHDRNNTFDMNRNRLDRQVQKRCQKIKIDPPYIFKSYMPESSGVSRAMDIDPPTLESRQLTEKDFKDFNKKYDLKVGEPQQALHTWIQKIANELLDHLKILNNI